MSNSSNELIPLTTLDDLLHRTLHPRINFDDAIRQVRHAYREANLTDRDWIHIRERVARVLARLRGHGPARSVRGGKHPGS